MRRRMRVEGEKYRDVIEPFWNLGEVPEELVGLDPSEARLVHHLRVVQALHLQEREMGQDIMP